MSSILDALKQAEKDKYTLLQKHQYDLIKDGGARKGFLTRANKIYLSLTAIILLSILTFFFTKIFLHIPFPFSSQTMKLDTSNTQIAGHKPKTQAVTLPKKEASIISVINDVNKNRGRTQISKTDAPKYNYKGVHFYKQGEFEKAIAEFQYALKADPEYSQAYYNLGIVSDDKGLYEQAIKEYKKALQINPAYEEALVNLGIIYSNKGLFKDALKFYKKALKINPDDADVHLNIGIVYAYHLIDKKKAVFHWKRYIELKPDGTQVDELRRAIAYF